ncbi:MAG: threo-3-hydroxy-L-aspartate ammonia-lyase [Phycisphaerales bacterium JB050]
MPDSPTTDAQSSVTFSDVIQAATHLQGHAHRTPVQTSQTLDACLGASAWCKCENFQRVGAFKFRGAFNAISCLSAEEKQRGVLTYSSGNHAQGIALAGNLLGVPTTIIMPTDAPPVKIEATRGYLGPGGEVVLYDRKETTREELGDRLSSERGLTVIPPYDHPRVIAGQGTVAKELVEAIIETTGAPPDLVFVCCGGGGLLSGCAIATKALAPNCTVIGVEPELADDATRSFKTGTLHTVHNPPTIADGARTPSLGSYTFPLVREHVDDMMTVSEAEIAQATLFAIERMKLVIEPSGALAMAGAIKLARTEPERISGKRVGIVISGGNIDLAIIPELRRLAGGAS